MPYSVLIMTNTEMRETVGQMLNDWDRTMRSLPVRRCSIECVSNPEWGTWGVMEDKGDYYEIRGRRGSRILSKDEAVRFWRLVSR